MDGFFRNVSSPMNSQIKMKNKTINTFRHRLVILSLVSFVALAGAVRASAQDMVDTVFHPPKGAQFAIVVFEDMECPMCRRVAPLVEQASKTYKIPVVFHDFPLPGHPWSYQAAVMARY